MEEIKKIIEDIFKSIGFKKPEIDIKKDNTSKEKEIININISLSSKEADYFIKNSSEGLSALQHVLRVIFSRKGFNESFLILDINGYRESRKNELVDVAIEAAKKVRRIKKAITLEPMSAFERRIIHLKLAESPDIVTESIGEEPERKVVVRLYP
jgi:spoIIIJ-associated protein